MVRVGQPKHVGLCGLYEMLVLLARIVTIINKYFYFKNTGKKEPNDLWQIHNH